VNKEEDAMAEQRIRPTARDPHGLTGANWQNPPAPVDAAGLADALRPFGESRMLPRSAYVDPAVFAWEQAYFFGNGWCCAGFSSQLAEAGDQRAEQTGSGSVLLVRGDDGMLRAFCQHLPAPRP
jgi:hypothetical protein